MLDLLVDLLPARLRPKAKAVIASGGAALLGYLIVGLATGEWDSSALAGLLCGFVGVPVYAVPNKKR